MRNNQNWMQRNRYTILNTVLAIEFAAMVVGIPYAIYHDYKTGQLGETARILQTNGLEKNISEEK